MSKQLKTFVAAGVLLLLALVVIWMNLGSSEPVLNEETARRAAEIEANLREASTPVAAEPPPPPPGVTAIRRGQPDTQGR